MHFAFVWLIWCLAVPASADPFKAAGRIENDGGGTCSASLIQPDVIVTAAHCLRQGDGPDYVFRLGGNVDVEPIRLQRVVVHPHYTSFRNQRVLRLRFDIAIAQLSSPVDPAVAVPFEIGAEAEAGEGLFLASWRGIERPRPRTRRCVVIDGAIPSVVTLGCVVRGGESGGPVLRLQDDGAELVAVINSRSRQGDRSVALAANARSRIQPLLDMLNDPS